MSESGLSTNVYGSPEIAYDPGQPRDFSPVGAASVAVMLGSGKPEPTPYRFGPGGAIIAEGTPYIIDAGEGIWRAIAKAAISHSGKLVDALDPSKLTTLFLTHLHSDHTVGLPGLLLLPWTCGRTKPLTVYGPVGTRRLVESVLDGYQGDVDERVRGPEQKNDTGWRATVREIEGPGLVHQDDNVRVEAFHHTHGGLKQNFGYRFVTADRTFVWAGDGVEGDAYRDAARNADVLFSDATAADLGSDAFPWLSGEQGEVPRSIWHIKSNVLGTMAREAGVRRLVVHHEQNYSRPYDPEFLAKEASEFFRSTVISARDGDLF